MIPQEFIERVLESTDLLELFRSHGVEVKKTGSNFMARCPFHNEKTPSLSISPHKNVYYCFGCGAKGNALTFLKEKEGLNFVESIHHLAAHLGLEVPDDQNFSREEFLIHKRKKEEILNYLQRAALFYYHTLKNTPAAIDYCKSRGLSGITLQKFGVGFAPNSWKALSFVFPDYHTNPHLLSSGLVIEKEGKRYDRFRNRLIIPILDKEGKVIAFGARVIGEGEPKYLNSPESVVFEKGKEWFGFYHAQKAMHQKDCAIVCEGYLDVMMLNQYGIENALATLGTATTAFHVRQLLRYVNKIYFAFDGDSAGQKAAFRALYNALPELLDSKRLFFIFFPENEDPDSFVRQKGKAGFEELFKNALPFSAFFFNHFEKLYDLKTPETRAQFLEAVAEPLSLLVDAPLLKSQLVKEIAARTFFKEEEVWAKLKISQNSVPAGEKSIFPKNSPQIKEGEGELKTPRRDSASSFQYRLQNYWRGLLECVMMVPELHEKDLTKDLLKWMDAHPGEGEDYALLDWMLHHFPELPPLGTPLAEHYKKVRKNLDSGVGGFSTPDEYVENFPRLIDNLKKIVEEQSQKQSQNLKILKKMEVDRG